MSGLRVPVFFGSILALIVLVLQNRTPAFQITLLGMRSQPLSLGVWVACAVITGVILGALLQRTNGRRGAPRQGPPSSKSPNGTYAGPAEYQPLRSIPETNGGSKSHINESEFDDFESKRPKPKTKAKGWDTDVSTSWTEQAEKVEEEGRFWSRPQKKPSRPGSVTPIRPSRNDEQPQKTDPVVDAEYRIVPPDQPERDDGFDDNFFDDFFDEDDA